MAQYEGRIRFSAETDAEAKQKHKAAARAVSGKTDKLLSERLTFRSVEEEEAGS